MSEGQEAEVPCRGWAVFAEQLILELKGLCPDPIHDVQLKRVRAAMAGDRSEAP